ncbi:MAG: hypothetical protein ACJAX2_002962, partial [Celeribacter sp.]
MNLTGAAQNAAPVFVENDHFVNELIQQVKSQSSRSQK